MEIQQNSGVESDEVDENDYHNYPKSHQQPSVKESKVSGNKKAVYRQMENNSLPQCPLYGSAMK